MSTVTVKYCDIPSFLREGEFFRNLDSDDTEDGIEVPANCFPQGDQARNLQEFSQLIRTMTFWILDEIPLGVLEFCRLNDVDVWQDALWSVVGIAESGVLAALRPYRFRGEVPVNDIVSSGRREVIMHLLPLLNKDGSATAQAAKLGSLRILKLIHNEGIKWHETTCHVASAFGHVECLQYAHENGCPWDSKVYTAAAKGGHVQCIQYAFQQRLPWHRDLCTYAAQYGHLKCLQYAKENECPWTAEVVRAAASSGRSECLLYALEHGCSVHDSACTMACQHGHLRCLQLLHQAGASWDEETCASAAWRAEISCLQYLHENGCPWDESTASVAASAGHINTLRYAMEHGCPFDDLIVKEAVKSGKLDCLMYLLQNQLLFAGHDVFLTALLSGDLECVQYLFDQGYGYLDFRLPSMEEQLEELDNIFKMNNPDFVKCVQYAVEHGCPITHDFVVFVRSRDLCCYEWLKEEGWSADCFDIEES